MTSTNYTFVVLLCIRSSHCLTFSLEPHTPNAQQQLEARESEPAELRASPATASSASTADADPGDGFDGEVTEARSELCELRAHLLQKSRELDTTKNMYDAVYAELERAKGVRR